MKLSRMARQSSLHESLSTPPGQGSGGEGGGGGAGAGLHGGGGGGGSGFGDHGGRGGRGGGGESTRQVALGRSFAVHHDFGGMAMVYMNLRVVQKGAPLAL